MRSQALIALLWVAGAAASGTLTLRVRCATGETVRLTVAEDATVGSAREQLAAGGSIAGDEALSLEKAAGASLPDDAVFSDLKLRNGAFLYVSRERVLEAAKAKRAERAEEAAAERAGAAGAGAAGGTAGAAGGSGFVPFPDLLRPELPAAGAGGSSLKALELEEQRQYKVKRQTDALVNGIRVAGPLARSLSRSAVAAAPGGLRALLLGRHEPATRFAEVEGAVLLERGAALSGALVESALAVGEWLHLRPVGWASAGEAAEGSLLRAGELAGAVALQVGVMERFGRDFGAKFFTLPLRVEEEEEQCVWETPLCVSRQCVMMAHEGALRLEEGDEATAVEATEAVRFGNEETRRVDVDAFLVPVRIEEGEEDGAAVGGVARTWGGDALAELRAHLVGHGKERLFQKRIADLDVLCALHREKVLPRATLKKICVALRKGRKVEGPLRQALDEALAEEDGEEEEEEEED